MNGLPVIFLLVSVTLVAESHFTRERKNDKIRSNNTVQFPEISPSISIVDLKRSSRRVSRIEAERNKKANVIAKNQVIPKKKPPPSPPPNCVPLKSSCRPPAPPCCEPCAFCHCHIFKTVCIYKMGNPYC